MNKVLIIDDDKELCKIIAKSIQAENMEADAIHKGVVTDKELSDYLESTRRKAYDLKDYINVLFDWFKLNSDEYVLDMTAVEITEETRNSLIDWIPVFEEKSWNIILKYLIIRYMCIYQKMDITEF